jgi:hypothetical protein
VAQWGIIWRGIDAAGYYYGFYNESQAQYQVDIAIPGKGTQPHKGPDYKVFVQGEKIGSMPTLKGAAAFAELYFREGHHRVRAQNAAVTKGREALQQAPRERGSMRDVLEAYLSRKPPARRSR